MSIVSYLLADKHTLLLASGSPRRRELISLTGLDYFVMPVNIDEMPQSGEIPHQYVMRLAREKTLAACQKNGGGMVLGADTIVADGNVLLGKPENRQQAVDMLKHLRGRVHQVYTALALWDGERQLLFTTLCKTPVPMRNYSDEELERYVDSGDPMDKAGAYGIQNMEFHPAEHFHGCFANVMGLPVCHLSRLLSGRGLELSQNIPARCQEILNYNCHIYAAILRGEDAG